MLNAAPIVPSLMDTAKLLASEIASAIPQPPYYVQPCASEYSGLTVPIDFINTVAYRHTRTKMFDEDTKTPVWYVWDGEKPIATDESLVYIILTNLDRGPRLKHIFSVGEGKSESKRISRGHERIKLLQDANYLCRVLYTKIPRYIGSRKSVENSLRAELKPVWDEWEYDEREAFRQSCGVYAA
jgi:hypothetical protein